MATTIATGTLGRAHTVPDVASSTFLVASGGQTLTGLTTVAPTFVAGVSGASGRAITGSTTLPVWTSGTAMGVAGGITGGGDISSGSYVYGTQGKVTVGAFTSSGILAGVYGQLDVTGSTIAAGNVAAVQANIYGYNTGTSTVLNGIYIEAAGGGVISSGIRIFGKSTYVFDIESNLHPNCSGTGTVGTTSAKGWIKVRVCGQSGTAYDRYIPLSDSVT